MSKPSVRPHAQEKKKSHRPPGPPLTSRAKLLLIAVGLVLACLLVGALELTLRLSGYGPNLRVFKETTLLGEKYREFNRDISLRFFPREMAKQPGFERFPAVKAPETYRIFSLGESATAGDPYGPQASFTAFLKQMLRDVHPEKTWEVVNCGIVAISSADVLDLMPEVLQQQPDAILLYVGHNEAYGADAVLSGLRGTVTNRGWMKLRIRARRLRIGLLAQDLMRKLRGGKPGATKEFGMDLMQGKVLPRQSKLHAQMLDIYRGNMEEIIGLARRRGIDVIFCAPPANLRDQSPFGSAHATTLKDETGWKEAAGSADRDMESRRWALALQALDQAAKIDSSYAEIRFRRARCLEALARPAAQGSPVSPAFDRTLPVIDPSRLESAAHEYRAALDEDIIHFRTCSDQLQVLHDLVRRLNDPHVLLVDLEKDLREASPDGIPGREIMTEHVHPTIQGHAFLAERICRSFFTSPLGEKLGPADFSRLRNTDEYLQRMGLNELDQATGLLLTVRYKMNKWPFTQAYENKPAVAYLERQIEALTRSLDPISLQVFSETAAGRFLDGYDYGLRHQEIARRAMAVQQIPLALREFQKCVDLWGPMAELAVNMAQGHLVLNHIASVDSLCDLASRLDPKFARVHFVRGLARRAESRWSEARSELAIYLQQESTGPFANAARTVLNQMPR